MELNGQLFTGDKIGGVFMTRDGRKADVGKSMGIIWGFIQNGESNLFWENDGTFKGENRNLDLVSNAI